MKPENIQISCPAPGAPHGRSLRGRPGSVPCPGAAPPSSLPCQAFVLCGPRPHPGGAGRRAQEPGRGQALGRRAQEPGRGQASGAAAPGREHLPSALYGRVSGHVNSYGGRGRGATAAGQLVSYGHSVGALPPARRPPLRSGDEGREAGTPRPPPLSPRDPPRPGHVRGRAGSPRGAPRKRRRRSAAPRPQRGRAPSKHGRDAKRGPCPAWNQAIAPV